MKLKYIAYIFTVLFLHTHLFAHQVLKSLSSISSLSNEEFEKELASFADRCGVVCFISDSDFKHTQEEMALSLKTKKSSKKDKNKNGSSKGVRPDNFDTDLYFLMKEKIEILNKEELVVFQTKLNARIDSADAVLSLGNILPRDVIEKLGLIKIRLNEVSKKLVLLEKEEKKEKQKKKELDEKVARWEPKLKDLLEDMKIVLEKRKEIIFLEDIDRVNISLFKNFQKVKDLRTRFIAIESKIPEIIAMQDGNVKKLIDEFNLDYNKLNSMFYPTSDAKDSINKIINILHDINSLFLFSKASREVYYSDSHSVSMEEFSLFHSQVKSNIFYLDRKIDKLKTNMLKMSHDDFHKMNIEKIINYAEQLKDDIYYALNAEIKKRYFKGESKSFELFMKANFNIVRSDVKSFEKSTSLCQTHDSDFNMVEEFFEKNNYLTQEIYCRIFKKFNFFKNPFKKAILPEVPLDDASAKEELLDDDSESFERVEKEEGDDDDLSCPSEFDYSSDDDLLGDREYPFFTEFEPIGWSSIPNFVEEID